MTLTPRHKRSLTSLLAATLAVLTLTTSAHAWWNDEWTMRKKVTLDTTSKGAAIDEQIGTSPILIRLHDGEFQFGAAREDGSDLRFVAADDKTPLTYHIEKFDALMGEAFVWVKLPDVKPGEQTTFWLYYGNQGTKATKADDPKGSFDTNTVLAYHFADKGQPPIDSSASGNNAEKAATPSDGSMIGAGLRLTGKPSVTIPESDSLTWSDGGAMTWSAWVKPTALEANAVMFSRQEGANAFTIGIDNGVPFTEVTGAGGKQRTGVGAPITVNSWHHLAVVADGAKTTLYLDGESYTTAAAGLPALKGPLTIGGDAANEAAAGLVGEMDELEISKVARPLGYLKLAAFGQGSEKAGKLLALGLDEQTSTWLSGTFGILMKSLTVDGWVVIGILIIMAAISWLVMFNKASYLSSISKGNALFMKEWRHVAADLTVLDDADEEKVKTFGGRVNAGGLKLIRSASVFRIYHIGAEEIRHRLAADRNDGTRKALSGRSIQAIRASLDGGLVRETQKLNSLMVFLTIAISGGPFLGLLGTVVGVMITFAAIAAAGDVNVNAIAPGIAAALVATVAGLVVAIPALFGYNYLTSKIKEATTDMHVFVDEFVTKMAEFYRD